MIPHDHDQGPAEGTSRLWSSPVRAASFALLGLMSLWMIYLHRVHVFTADAIPLALLVACLGMHLVMHRGHGGGHGGGHRKGDGSR
jgi:hypothetical protein